jgi:ribosomal protein S18 acetylase RimI-like enzyme
VADAANGWALAKRSQSSLILRLSLDDHEIGVTEVFHIRGDAASVAVLRDLPSAGIFTRCEGEALMPMGVIIREAEPKDIPFIAWVQLAAARGHLQRGFWEIALNESEQECLRFIQRVLQAPTRSWCHLSVFIVAEVDSRPAAALCGFDHHELGGMVLRRAIDEVAGGFGWRRDEIAAVWARYEAVATCTFPDPEPGAWVIENAATSPEYRRQGLIQELIAKMLDRGEKRGYRRAQIGVLIGNDKAQKAYEKAGFVVIAEKRHRDFERVVGAPGVRCLLREI